jgi:hypothetical protein
MPKDLISFSTKHEIARLIASYDDPDQLQAELEKLIIRIDANAEGRGKRKVGNELAEVIDTPDNRWWHTGGTPCVPRRALVMIAGAYKGPIE